MKVYKKKLKYMAKLIVRYDKFSVRYIGNKFTTCQKYQSKLEAKAVITVKLSC